MEKDFRDSVANYIEIGKEVMYLTRQECIQSALSDVELIELIEETLDIHGKKALMMPAKIGISSKRDTFFNAMPAYIEKRNICGIKWVSGFPDNRKKFGLPQTVGLSILNDSETGFPLVIMDATWITTERTSAVTMVGIKYLANSRSETFGMIGCGAVGRKHVAHIPLVLPHLKKIVIFDNFSPAMDQLIDELQPKTDVEIVKASSYEEVVKNCEVIASATTILDNVEPVIKDSWISSGQTLFLCDMHTLYEDRTMKRGDKYILDSIEHHELYAKMGSYPQGLPEVYGELGEIVAGMKPGREHPDELIINNNIGMACEDMMLSVAICERALANGLGQKMIL